jgi:hypothetical protein
MKDKVAGILAAISARLRLRRSGIVYRACGRNERPTRRRANVKTSLLAILVMAAPAMLGAQQAEASPPSKSSWQVRGHGAHAWAFGGDHCVWTSLDVGANDEVVHQSGGAPVKQKGAWVGFSSYNWCDGTETWGWAFIPNVGFSGSLNTASVSVSFEVQSYAWQETPDGWWDYTFLGTSTLTANVAWAGTGETVQGMNQWMSRFGKSMVRNRWRGQFRQADVTVNATLGGAALTFDGVFGEVGKYNAGGTEVFHH